MPVRVTPKAQAKAAPSRGRTGPVRVSPPRGRPIIEPGKPVRYEAPSGRGRGSGGLLGTVRRIPGDIGRDFYKAAVGLPAGLYYMGEAAARDTGELLNPGRLRPGRGAGQIAPRSRALGENIAKSTIEDFRHPLRHPGNTILNVVGLASLGAGTAARGAAAVGAAKKGATAGQVARAAVTKPKPGVRTFKVGDLEVQHPESRSALTRGALRAADRRRQAKAAKKPGGRAAKAEIRKAGRALEETLRAEEALGKMDAAALAAVGKRLKPDEQYALRVVAEQAPLNERIATTRAAIKNSRGAERRRHAKRLSLLEGARKHIVNPDGKPELPESATKLRAVYDRMEKVATSREELAKGLGLLTDEAIQQRKTDAGRAAMGATWTTPAHEAVRKLDLIERRRAELKPQPVVIPGEKIVKERKRTRREAEAEGLIAPPAPGAKRAALAPDDEKRLSMLDSALDPLVSQWAKEVRGEGREARKGTGYVGKTREELMRDRKGWRQAGVDPNLTRGDFDDADMALGPAKGFRNRRAQRSPEAIAEEMLSQAAGRDPMFELDLNTMLTVVEQLRDQGVDMAKLRKALDERDELRQRVIEAVPDPDEAFAAAAAATAPEPDYGTVRVEKQMPDRTEPGVHTPEARAELDRLADEERAAARDVRVNKPRLYGRDDFEATPDAVYVPDVEQRVGRTGRISSVGAQGVVGHLRSPIREGYTGAQKRAARDPVKTTRAVAEAKLAVARFARLAALRDKLVQASAPRPRFKDDIAVRLDKIGQQERLPKDVVQFIDEPEELAMLTPDEQLGKFEALRSSMIVGDDKLIRQMSGEQLAEFTKLEEQGKIGWVPKRLLGDLAKPHAPLQASLGKVPTQVVDSINNAQRLAVLYLKPAYAVPNILGNAALNVVQQGFAAPKHLYRASRMQWQLGPELTARIDTLMHEGFAAALRGETGALAGATQAAANVWGKGVDRPFRRASFSYEAGRNGHKTPKQLERLLTDPAMHDELIDVTKRANRQIIDYGRLSHREREIVRRVIFFYPWVKGSTVYAGNLLAEYPAKAAVVGAVGREGVEESDRRIGDRPSYLEGAIETPWGLSNPAAAAILQTPAQVGAATAALATGRVPEVAELTEFPTPALQFGTALYTGENARTGRRYQRNERGIPRIAYDTLITQTPQYRLQEQVRGTSKARLFTPSPRAGLMQFLLGGIYPRQYDPDRLKALAKRERKELAGR